MEIIKEVLPNGLTVILAPIESCKSVAEIFITRAGWKYEYPEISGISHFTEHMFFRGTEKRPSKKAINNEIISRGGLINAGTEEDYASYWVKISGRFLSIAHDVLSDMIMNSRFSPEGINIEKSTILEELRGLQDDPEKLVSDILWPKLLYGKQPAGECGIGNEKSLVNLKRKHLLDYVASLYVGPNSGLITVGNIESPAETIKNLNYYFGRLSPTKPKIEKSLTKESQRKPRIAFKYRDTSQTHIKLGVRAHNVFHPDQYAQKVLEVILGGNMSSRMFTELREKRGLAYDIESESRFQTDIGFLATSAGLNSKRVAESIKLIMEQYRKTGEKKVTQKELRGAKDFIIGSFEMVTEDSDAMAQFLAEQFALTNEIESPAETIEKFEAVTAEDVQQVAQDIFRDERLNLVVVGKHRQLRKRLQPILKF